METTDPDPRNHAGPYGFTRREIGVLAGILVICVAVIAYSEWRDSKKPSPAWVIEDVLLEDAESSESPAPMRLIDSASTTDVEKPATPKARDHSDLIDVNSADVRALARLPGIGAELARRMIEERTTNGSFVNLTDLQRVRGIGPRKAAMLSGWVKFSSETQPAEDTSETP